MDNDPAVEYTDKATAAEAKTYRERVIKAIMGVRQDDYNAISLKTMEGLDAEGTDEIQFYISIDDTGNGAAFFFEDVHELHTFAKRLLARSEEYLPA